MLVRIWVDRMAGFGTNMPEPEEPPAGNGAAMPGQEPTVPRWCRRSS